MAFYERFLDLARRQGYKEEDVRRAINDVLPQLFFKTKKEGIPREKVVSKLNTLGLPQELWHDPASVQPDAPSPATPYPAGVNPHPAIIPTPEGSQEVAKAITMPARGLRALGVMGEKVLGEHFGAPEGPAADIVTRGAAAVDPRYQPQPGEKLGAFVGESLDPVFWATVEASGGISGALKLGRITKAGADMALASGAMSAVHQMAANGEIDPKHVGLAAATGAAVGAAGVKAFDAAASLAEILPAIRERIGNEIEHAVNRAKNGLGLPTEHGLVPYDFKKAVAEGRMTSAEAARGSEEIFQQVYKKHGGGSVEASAVKTAPEVKSEPLEPVVEAPEPHVAKPKGRETRAEAPAVSESPISTTPEPKGIESYTGFGHHPTIGKITPEFVKTIQAEHPEAKDIKAVEGFKIGDYLSGVGFGTKLPQDPARRLRVLEKHLPYYEKALERDVARHDQIRGGDITAAGYTGAKTEEEGLRRTLELTSGHVAYSRSALAGVKAEIARLKGGEASPEVTAAAAPAASPEASGGSPPSAPNPPSPNPAPAGGSPAVVGKVSSAPSVTPATPPVKGPREILLGSLAKTHGGDAADPAFAKKMLQEHHDQGHDFFGRLMLYRTGKLKLSKAAAKTLENKARESFRRMYIIKTGEEPTEAMIPGKAEPAPVAKGGPKSVQVIKADIKTAALKKLEEAITKAPVGDRPAKGKMIELKVDGGVKVLNWKPALEDLKARLRALPEKLQMAPTFKAQNLTRTSARRERWEPLIEVKGSKDWFTDGTAAIKGDPPAHKMSGRDTTLEALQKTLAAGKKASVSAELQYYFIQNGPEGGVSPTPMPESIGHPFAVYRFGDKFTAYKQGYINAISTRYPDATFRVNEKNGMLIASTATEDVAMVMPYRMDGRDQQILSRPPLEEEAAAMGLHKPLPVPPPEPPAPDGPLEDSLIQAKGEVTEMAERPVSSKDDQRRAFQTLAARSVDRERAFEILTDIFGKLGIKGVSFKEKTGWTRGHYDPSDKTIMVDNIDNVATLIHEGLGHGVDHALGTLYHLDKKFPLQNKLGLDTKDAALEAKLKGELKAVSMEVRPFYPTGKEGNWSAYRSSHPELFADFMTMFAMSPKMTRELAPTFTDLWLKRLERDPKIKAALEPFLGPDSPFLKTDISGLSPARRAQRFLEWAKGVEVDPEVRVEREAWGQIPRKWSQRIVDLISLPFWRGQGSRPMAGVFNTLQNGMYKAARLQTIGIEEMARLDDFAKLPVESRDRISRAIWKGNDQPVQRYFTPEELARGPFYMTPEEIKAYGRIVKALRFGTGILIKFYKEQIGFDLLPPDAQAAALLEIKEGVQRLGGYVPIYRSGDYVVYATSVDGDPWFSFSKTKDEAATIANKLVAAGYQNPKLAPRKELPPDFFANMRRLGTFEIEMLIDAAGVSRDDPVVKKILEEAKVLKFGNMIKRRWIPGFLKTPDHLMETIETFINSTSRKLTKYQSRRDAGRIINQIDPKKDPRTYTQASKYVDNFFNTDVDEYKTLRKGIYAFYLAGNIRNFFQDMLHPLLVTHSEIARFQKGLSPEKTFFQAYAKTLKLMMDGAGKPQHDFSGAEPKLRRLLERANREGLLDDPLTAEMMSERIPGRRKVERIITVLERTTGIVKRIHGLVSAFEIAKKAGFPEKAMYDFAKEFIHRTSYVYSKANLPRLVAGAGDLKGAVRMAYMMKSFQLNYMNRLYRQLGPEFEPRVASRAVADLLGLAGLGGVPFAALIMYAFNRYGGVDIETGIRRKLRNTMLADMLMTGLPGAMGMDTRSMMGVGDIVQAPRHGQSLAASVGQAAIGPAGGLIDKVFAAFNMASGHGEPARVAEMLTPSAIGNILKGARVYKEGVRSAKGDLIKPVSGYEAGLTSVGIRPMSVSRAYAKNEAIEAMKDRARMRLSEYVERIAKATFDHNQPEVDRLIKEVQRHNASAKPEEMIRVRKTLIKDRLMRMQSEDLGRRVKHIPKQLRRATLDIEEAYR